MGLQNCYSKIHFQFTLLHDEKNSLQLMLKYFRLFLGLASSDCIHKYKLFGPRQHPISSKISRGVEFVAGYCIVKFSGMKCIEHSSFLLSSIANKRYLMRGNTFLTAWVLAASSNQAPCRHFFKQNMQSFTGTAVSCTYFLRSRAASVPSMTSLPPISPILPLASRNAFLLQEKLRNQSKLRHFRSHKTETTFPI